MGPKKIRNHNQKRWTKTDTLGDIALADFADANVPMGSGRVRKSKSNLPLSCNSAPIEDVEEDLDIDTVLAGKVDATKIETADATSDINGNDLGLILSDEIWIMLSEYMRPQDVLNFSLICKSSYRIVNSPLFWIKIYKRYYTSKVYMPAFLKKHCLERHLGLKAKVVRSLYYTYTPFHESLRRHKSLLKTLIGHRCELMWVQRARDKEGEGVHWASAHSWVPQGETDQITAQDLKLGFYDKEELACWLYKEINDNNNLNPTEPMMEKWIYSFKLSNKPDASRSERQTKRKTKQDIINHNPDDTCCLLEVICKEYVDPKCVIGMKLRKAAVEDRCVQLKFSSAPLSRFGTDFGAIDIYLNALRPPAIYDWWHPHFYNQQY